MLTDCHVHVSLYPGPTEVCDAAALYETALIGVACSLEDSIRNLEFAKVEGYHPMIGIHPWYAKSRDFPEMEFERLLTIHKVEGFGECGLDAENYQISLGDQVHLLAGELSFASFHHLPVSLHVRKAHDELIRLLRFYKSRGLTGAIHNFTFSKELARDYLDCNMFLSVGAHLLKKPRRLIESMQYAGPNRILLESDFDHQQSGPYDGALISKLARVYAQVFKLSYEQSCLTLESNVKTYLNGIF